MPRDVWGCGCTRIGISQKAKAASLEFIRHAWVFNDLNGLAGSDHSAEFVVASGHVGKGGNEGADVAHLMAGGAGGVRNEIARQAEFADVARVEQ